MDPEASEPGIRAGPASPFIGLGEPLACSAFMHFGRVVVVARRVDLGLEPRVNIVSLRFCRVVLV